MNVYIFLGSDGSVNDVAVIDAPFSVLHPDWKVFPFHPAPEDLYRALVTGLEIEEREHG